MSGKVVYTTSAVAVGGRDGITGTTDGSFEVKLAPPKELGGNGDGNNPEQLFASGYAACLLSSMQFLAASSGRKVPTDAEVMVRGGLWLHSEGRLGFDVAVDVTLPGVPRTEAQLLIEKAHQISPYSKAIRNNVAVKLGVSDA
jgi:lipoyl-dependent peroxiredoxin